MHKMASSLIKMKEGERLQRQQNRDTNRIKIKDFLSKELLRCSSRKRTRGNLRNTKRRMKTTH